jgi:hypothetical protein
MKQQDYKRDYIHVPMRQNTSQSKDAPIFVAHNITSKYLTEYVKNCIQHNRQIAFDFAINQKPNEFLIVMSMPYFEQRRTKTLEDFIE